jgi:hypothetical protein
MCQEIKTGGMGPGDCQCGCCGCGCGPFGRRYFSKSEKQQWIENYREQLKLELAAVEQQINECKEG